MTIHRWVYSGVAVLLLSIYLAFFAEINQFVGNFARSSFGQNFFSNLLATVVGLIIGIPIALGINNQVETLTERAKRKRILELLSPEIEKNKNIISVRDFEKDDWHLTTIGVKLSDEVWNAFSDGGEIAWIKDTAFVKLPKLVPMISRQI